jgi:hypothetical protein
LTEVGGLDDLIAWQASLHTRDQQRLLQKEISEALAADAPMQQIVERTKQFLVKNPMSDTDVIDRVSFSARVSYPSFLSVFVSLAGVAKFASLSNCQIFTAVMDAVEWNKKPDLIAEQALRHLKASNTVTIGFFHILPMTAPQSAF